MAGPAPGQSIESRAEPLAQSRPDSLEVRVGHLAVVHELGSGEAELRIPDPERDTVYRVRIPGLYLDGEPQREFEPVGSPTAMLATLRNSAVELSLEPLDDRSIALTWSVRDGASHEMELRLLSDDRTGYYGTGERFNALDQRGYVLPLISDDRYGNKGVGAYKPVPFFMSTQGFGVWVDSYAPGAFDLSGSQRFVSRLTFHGTRLRVVFFGGPAFEDILDAFTRLTGRPRVPPPWSLALWKSRDVHQNQDSVIADIERLRRHDIPSSVLVIDSPWETGYNDFEVNRRQFPRPDAMFSRIRRLGFHLCLWLTPFINRRNVIDMTGIAPASSNYDEAARAGHLVEDSSGAVALSEWWKGEGGLVDFTDPAAVAWWLDQLRRTLAYGARAFKADDGEGNFVPDAVFHDGTPAASMKNRYAVLYDSVMAAFVESELGGDGAVIARSGYTGAGRLTFSWAGDNDASFDFDDGLPSVILAGQNAALSGIALWGSDIAGYAGRPSKELFLRWTQVATFTPFMQVHMTSNLGPWDFDEEALAIFRHYARLRVELFPYLYEALHEAARTGLPPIRPMVLAFQDDPATHGHVYQYMFGPDLLVAPMYRSGQHRPVYLPEGTWIDYWTGRTLTGGRVLEADALLDRIPLFVRAGAILPLLPDDVETLIPRHDDMDPDIVAIDERRVLQVWPGQSGGLETWEGLRAGLLTAAGDTRILRVSSERPRPLDIELVYRDAFDIEAEGATIRHDPERRRTSMMFPELAGPVTVTWRER